MRRYSSVSLHPPLWEPQTTRGRETVFSGVLQKGSSLFYRRTWDPEGVGE